MFFLVKKTVEGQRYISATLYCVQTKYSRDMLDFL